MPPKGRTKSAGSKLAWESELVAAELNDSEWSTQVHYILGDTPQATAETCERLNKAQVTRERFSILTAEYILASIQDSGFDILTSAILTSTFCSPTLNFALFRQIECSEFILLAIACVNRTKRTDPPVPSSAKFLTRANTSKRAPTSPTLMISVRFSSPVWSSFSSCVKRISI